MAPGWSASTGLRQRRLRHRSCPAESAPANRPIQCPAFCSVNLLLIAFMQAKVLAARFSATRWSVASRRQRRLVDAPSSFAQSMARRRSSGRLAALFRRVRIPQLCSGRWMILRPGWRRLHRHNRFSDLRKSKRKSQAVAPSGHARTSAIGWTSMAGSCA